MTDLNPNVADKPIEVPASPASAQTGAGTRDVLLLLAAMPAFVAVLGTRDVTKMVAYVGSGEFAPAAGVLVALGTFLWRQWLTRKRHTNDVKMAKSADDSVAFVTKDKP